MSAIHKLISKSVDNSLDNSVEDPLWNLMRSSMEDSARWYAIDRTRFAMHNTVLSVEESIYDFVYFSVSELNNKSNNE